MAGKNPYLKKATGTQRAPARVDKKKHGLGGKGLNDLLSFSRQNAEVKAVAELEKTVATAVVPEQEVKSSDNLPVELPIMDIERSPFQPRRDFNEEELKELSESLKNNGLVQPPTVRKNAAGKYELIAGERRLRAALLAGWKKIRVTIIEADDLTAAAMTTTENLQREDLNPIEEALSYKTLQDRFELTQEQVAEKIGKGRATVANSLRLLALPDEVKALVQGKLLSVGHAKLLLSLDSEKDRVLLARDCVNDQLTVRALEKRILRMRQPVAVKQPGTPDLPSGYVSSLTDKLKKHFGCAVRLTSGVTQVNGKHTKGVLEIDFFDNDELDRIIRLIGIEVE